MDEKTRGLSREELGGRGDESPRNYAGEPTSSRRTTPASGTGRSATRTNKADDLDPETARRTRQIEGNIEHTRAELSETIDALQEKLRPSNLVSDATDRVKTATTEKVRDMADTAGDTVHEIWADTRQNPLPALLIGAGVAWMLYDRSSNGNGNASRNRREYSSRRYARAYEPYDRGEARGTEDRWDEARSQAHEAGTWAREAGSEARQRARRAQNGMQRMLRQNPLLVGAAAMLVGAAVGASLPETERENELMGEARDSVVDRAQHAAENAVSAAKEATNDVVGDTVSKVAERVTGNQS
jgi:hypothetical protein